MNWKNIKLIFQREVRDQLRDRRTLFMVAVLPLLLYPALGIGMVQMTVTFSEQTRHVVIVGADQLPQPSLVDGNRLDPAYFEVPTDVDRLQLVTDRPGWLEQVADPKLRSELQEFLVEVEQRRGRIERLAQVQQILDRTPADSPDAQALLQEETLLRREIEGWFSIAPVQVLLVFPSDFLKRYDEVSQALRSGALADLESIPVPRPVVLHNSADEKSEIAYQRIRKALQNWEHALLQERLRQAQLPSFLPNPVPLTTVDLAEADQIAANVWSKIFPALLVIMSVTGAFYPAIDLGAGEKERGTMETLLISPATRTEIVLGKFLTVMLFSISTALLNLASMGFTGRHMINAVGSIKSSPLGDLSFPPLTSLTWVILLAIPLAALFSALSLSLAMFARSSKEGQYYLTPLLLVTMGLTVFCVNPGVELTPYYSVLPVTGPALLLKALLLGGATSVKTVAYAVPVLLTSCAYSVLALWWAIDQFQREDILFREAERFELRLWIRHLLREKESTPSFSEAGVCFVIIALLQFLFLTSLQGSPDLLNGPEKMVQVQLIYLIATVGVPPMFMALLLTSSFRRTLKLAWPNWKFLVAAIVLSFSLQPLALELLRHVQHLLPNPPAGAEALMGAMGTVPLWLSLSAFALAPAICEELAFRGFILSGLERARRRWLPIVISAILFGVIHMIPRQQFNATLIGLVLGLLAVRSRSLLPGVIFHFLFNGTQVLVSRIDEKQFQQLGLENWMKLDTAGGAADLRFSWWFLLICGVVSLTLITWLLRRRSPESLEEVTFVPASE